MAMDKSLKEVQKIYIIGIEGAGTSALAGMLKLMGKEVRGSDEGDHFYGKTLEKLEIPVFEKFAASNWEKVRDWADWVVYSTAQNPGGNIELKLAQTEQTEASFQLLSYPQALGQVFNQKFGLAVCGTHGKTTTTAMLTLALEVAGKDPSAVIGSRIPQLGNSGSRVGQSDYFVLEADEYQNKLRHYEPKGVILNNLDYDHVDFYLTRADYRRAFADFVAKIPSEGFLVIWGEEPNLIELTKVASCPVMLFGELNIIRESFRELNKQGGELREEDFQIAPWRHLQLQIPGRHNQLNANAVLAATQVLQLDQEAVITALESYQGAERRFQIWGERQGAVIIDDYAHHPREIEVTLRAAQEKFPQRSLVVVFHPHTFTRTKAFLQEFSQSFGDCEELILLDIYGSAREKKGTIHARDLVKEIERNSQRPAKVSHLADTEEAFEDLRDRLNSNQVLITMGAGDVWRLAEKLAH